MLCCVADDILLMEYVQSGKAGSTGGGMSGVGQTVGELATAGHEYIGYFVRHQHAAKRHVAVGYGFGKGNQSGRNG